MVQIVEKRLEHDAIIPIAILYSFKNSIVYILKNSRRKSKMAANFTFSAIQKREISFCMDDKYIFGLNMLPAKGMHISLSSIYCIYKKNYIKK